MRSEKSPQTRFPQSAYPGRRRYDLALALNFDAGHTTRLLLLIHSLAYETDATVRENMLIASTEKLAVYVDGVDEAAEKAICTEGVSERAVHSPRSCWPAADATTIEASRQR